MIKHTPLTLAALLVSLLQPVTATADPVTSATVVDDSGNYGDTYGYGRGRNLGMPGVLADLVLLRPLGVAMTVGGVGLLVATSPFTGIAAISPPHDAFERASNAFVIGPAGFTFNRPLGEFSYQRSGVYPILTKPVDRVPQSPPVPVATQQRLPAPVPEDTSWKGRPQYQYSPNRLEYPTGENDRNP